MRIEVIPGTYYVIDTKAVIEREREKLAELAEKENPEAVAKQHAGLRQLVSLQTEENWGGVRNPLTGWGVF